MIDADECNCEFNYPEPDDEESWHYLRTCPSCNTEWGALHCEHDGYQDPCPGCGWIAANKQEPTQALLSGVIGMARLMVRPKPRSIITVHLPNEEA